MAYEHEADRISPPAKQKHSSVLDFELEGDAERATRDLDGAHSGKLADQSADLENHADEAASYDPNAIGKAMRQPYTETSPVFEEDNGFSQDWNELQQLPSEGQTSKPRRSYPA